LVGDPYQYGAVKARGGLLSTLAHELPDAVELREVFRQHDEKERVASKRLRTGVLPDVERAADFYAGAGRLHAGSVTAMLDDALAGWRGDVAAGKDSLLVASTHDYVDALNRAAQQSMIAAGVVDGAEAIGVAAGQFAHVGDTILTRRNDYELTTSGGDVVRNGQRWQVEAIEGDGFVLARRLDDTAATVRLPPAEV
ncbi:AAA family ATPase, partial [Corynebacterium glutamicum]|uniref:AAA family ATPase n=1 Tax=Corynebacterium glutamicum TaxID=1718 RepID=UPI000961758B